MNLIEIEPPVVAEPDWRRLLGRKAEREAAAESWRMITGEMERRQILSPANGHAVMRLVVAYVLHDRALTKVMRAGPVNEPAKGNARAIARPNPYLAVTREMAALCAQIEGDLGLSPRSRNRVGKTPIQQRRTPASTYLRPVPSLGKPPTGVPPLSIVTPEKERTE